MPEPSSEQFSLSPIPDSSVESNHDGYEMFEDLNPLTTDTTHNFSELESPYLSHSLSRLALEKCCSPLSPNLSVPQLSPFKWSPTDQQINTPPKLPDASQPSTETNVKGEIEEESPNTMPPLPSEKSPQLQQKTQSESEQQHQSIPEPLPPLSPEYYTSESDSEDSDINSDQPNLRRSTRHKRFKNLVEVVGFEPREVKLRHPHRWSPEEDEHLKAAVKLIGERNWRKIATKVPGRNHVQCLQRWKKVLAPGLKKGHWSPSEDEILINLLKQGVNKWTTIAESIPGRTAKQCRERWNNHLDPAVNKGEWTPSEDKIIIDGHYQYGNRWSVIAKLLPGRTENAVKIRWKSLDRKERKKNRLMLKEQIKKQEMLMKNGKKDSIKIEN